MIDANVPLLTLSFSIGRDDDGQATERDGTGAPSAGPGAGPQFAASGGLEFDALAPSAD